MITTTEVTLTLGITDDGRLAVTVDTPTRYNAVELLGLLEMAKRQRCGIPHQPGQCRREETR